MAPVSVALRGRNEVDCILDSLGCRCWRASIDVGTRSASRRHETFGARRARRLCRSPLGQAGQLCLQALVPRGPHSLRSDPVQGCRWTLRGNSHLLRCPQLPDRPRDSAAMPDILAPQLASAGLPLSQPGQSLCPAAPNRGAQRCRPDEFSSQAPAEVSAEPPLCSVAPGAGRSALVTSATRRPRMKPRLVSAIEGARRRR